MRHTKIIATVGPACDDEVTLGRMIAAGVDVFRLNFAHGTHETLSQSLERVRRASTTAGRVVGVLADLGGPKLRTGLLKGGASVTLATGDELVIATGDFEGDLHRLSTPYADLAKSVKPGNTLLLDDGRIQLEVIESDGMEIRLKVLDGGKVGERKGISAPGVPLPPGAITSKDLDDLLFGLEKGIDLFGLSFVQSPDDIRQARTAGETTGKPVHLIAKLERPSALERLDEIVEVSDGVMVARGDLGLEMPLEQVPRAQKTIIRRARAHGIPVIVATQVLESMRVDLRPTRAEVSDAAHSVELGVDAIMLAGETAMGAFPVRTVQTLDLIIREAEKGADSFASGDTLVGHGHALALCEAALTLTRRGDAQAIAAITRNGHTAQLLAALRPSVPIYAATTDPSTARRLTLFWGVVPLLLRTTKFLESELLARELVAPGAAIVLVNVSPQLDRHDANFLRLIKLS